MMRTIAFCGLVGFAWSQSQLVVRAGGSSHDYGFEPIQLQDGSFVITGWTWSFGSGGEDLVLTKFGDTGSLLWTTVLGGSGDDAGYSVVQTNDHGFLVVGRTTSFGAGNEDILISRFDSLGNHLWSKTVGGADEDVGLKVILTQDGGFVISGRTLSFGAGDLDILLARFDSSGNLVWSTVMGGIDYEEAYSLIQTESSDLVITGVTASFGANPGVYDIILSRFDSSGNPIWTRVLGGANWDYGRSLVQTTNNDLVVAGETYSFGAGERDIILSRFDSSGNPIWTRVLGGASEDVAYGVVQTQDKGLVVAGHTYSFGAGQWDIILSKVDSAGNHVWTRTMGDGLTDIGYRMTQTSDEGFVVTGWTRSFGSAQEDILLAKFDGTGTSCIMGSANPSVSSVSPSLESPNPTVSHPILSVTQITPDVSAQNPSHSVICYSMDTQEEVLESGIKFGLKQGQVLLYLPKADRLSLCLYDASGRLVQVVHDGVLSGGSHSFSLKAVNRGVYFVVMRHHDQTKTLKITR